MKSDNTRQRIISHGLLTWHDATTYSQWVGKSLSTEAEWEYATLGGLINKRYVWGRDNQMGQSPIC